jgi:CMP-2-keto-3-deoxyoctulosonic acid synthetase
MKVLPVMIAKGHSSRLLNKNTKDFCGAPLFEWNLSKLTKIFGSVVLDSDDNNILKSAEKIGAIPHPRNKKVLGNDVPSILIFRSILEDFSDFDALINVQANSPNVKIELIQKAHDLIQDNHTRHLLTLNKDMTWNGSVWCIHRDTIFSLKDFYNLEPDMFLIDNSVDIHTQEEFDKALKIEMKHINKDKV